MTTDIKKILEETFKAAGIVEQANADLVKTLSSKIEEYTTLANFKAKLAVLYEYEKNYLELVKTYKEEIKFAGNLQEDLRKERAKFFAETIKEVSSTLANSQVDNNVASTWIKELVSSYTKSLDISSGLIEEHTLDMIGVIRNESKNEKNKVEITESNGLKK